MEPVILVVYWRAPKDQGFDDSLLMESFLYLPEDDPDVVNSKQEFDSIDRFLWRAARYAASFNSAGSDAFEPRGYLTDYYTAEAVKVIENNKDRPFFLYLAHFAPHTPLQASKADYEALSHIESHRERVYAVMILALDRGVGQVMAALKENGIDDNTIVMFTSDNGGAGYLGLPRQQMTKSSAKLTMYASDPVGNRVLSNPVPRATSSLPLLRLLSTRLRGKGLPVTLTSISMMFWGSFAYRCEHVTFRGRRHDPGESRMRRMRTSIMTAKRTQFGVENCSCAIP